MRNKIITNLNKIGALLLTGSLLWATTPVYAASLSSISDTMTRQKTSTLSSHTIAFTLSGSNTVAANETITIDFGEDSSYFVVAGAATAIADITFNDGTARTIVGVDGLCTGHVGVNDVAVGIDDATGIVTLTACGTYTASAAGATATFTYGVAAGGTDRVTNPAVKGTYVIPIAGTWTTPQDWVNFCKDDAADCGFGYTSSDTSVSGTNRFLNGTYFAKYIQAAPGDILADHTDAVNGLTGAVSNESFTITHKVSTSQSQAASTYQTTLTVLCTANY